MARLIEVERKSAVLGRPSLPCISMYHAINLAAGCVYGCRYCYAQSFASHPGKGRVVFYANTFELLEKQLERMRRKPRYVYFSTACEPFMPFKQILETQYSVMKLLLENRIAVRISTKSKIPVNFIELFSKYPELVNVQMGLTTINDEIRAAIEPEAATPNDRLQTLKIIKESGIKVGVRIDPLIPGLTDTETSFAEVCRSLAECGVDNAIASYLFLRRSIYSSMDFKVNGYDFRKMGMMFFTHNINQYCGGGSIKTASPAYRNKKYGLLKRIAADNGINIQLCKCKNPDVTNENCQVREDNRAGEIEQLGLFQ